MNLASQCLLPSTPAVRTLQLFPSLSFLSLQSLLIAGLDEHTQAGDISKRRLASTINLSMIRL